MAHYDEALSWIVGILRSHGVPFHITGGLAAHLYGAERPVNDIDIDIPEAAFERIHRSVSDYAVFGPARYRDSTWDIYLMTLDYGGQLIDLTAREDAYLRDKRSGKWSRLAIDVEKVTLVRANDMHLPVQNALDLIAYKSRIGYEEEKHLGDIAAVLSYLDGP